MGRSESVDWTISSVKRGHLTSVICGQSSSALTITTHRGSGLTERSRPQLPEISRSAGLSQLSLAASGRITRSDIEALSQYHAE